MSPPGSNVPDVDEPAADVPRPKTLEPEELGYRRRRPVRWLGPVLLAATGARVALADQFGAYLDKRELQYPFPKQVHDHSQGEEFWFDFAADTGGGLHAPYPIPCLRGQAGLRVKPADSAGPDAPAAEHENLPRGQV